MKLLYFLCRPSSFVLHIPAQNVRYIGLNFMCNGGIKQIIWVLTFLHEKLIVYTNLLQLITLPNDSLRKGHTWDLCQLGSFSNRRADADLSNVVSEVFEIIKFPFLLMNRFWNEVHFNFIVPYEKKSSFYCHIASFSAISRAYFTSCWNQSLSHFGTYTHWTFYTGIKIGS